MGNSNTALIEPQIIPIDTNTLLIKDKSTLKLIERFMHYPDRYLSHLLTWNDIMPVVDRIESTPVIESNGHYEMQVSGSYIIVFENNPNNAELFSIDGESRLSAITQAIITFIQWYNQNK